MWIWMSLAVAGDVEDEAELSAEPVARTTVMTEEFLDRVPTGRDYLRAVSGSQGVAVDRGPWASSSCPSEVRPLVRVPDLSRAHPDRPADRWMPRSACKELPDGGYAAADLDTWHVRSLEQALAFTTRDLSQPVRVFVDGVPVH